jgi:cytoskeletal protein RodZ
MSDQPLLKTAGELLGEARVAQGLSLEVLSERTKISVKVLSALEMDEYHKISGPLYIKSFLRTCATDLGLDADHVLDLYTRFGGERGGSPNGDMVWEDEEVQVSRVGLPWPRILMAGGLAVILIGVVLFAVRGCGGGEGSESATAVIDQDIPMSEEATPAEGRRGSLLAAGSDSLAPEGEGPDQATEEDPDQTSGDQTDDPEKDAVAVPVEEKPDPVPVRTEPVVEKVEEKHEKACWVNVRK